MDVKEIVHCAMQIEKSNADGNYGNILTLLSDLGKSHIAAEQLEVTDVVKVLYRLLKSCSDPSVKETSKSLLTKWKRQYSRETIGVKCTNQSKDPELSFGFSLQHVSGSGDISKQMDSHSVSPQTSDKEGEYVKPTTGREASSIMVKDRLKSRTAASPEFSSVRTKCIELLHGALCSETPGKDEAAELAEDIERCIHELHRSNPLKYKACVRSKVANLRNPKNGHLRLGILSRTLSPEDFARMSAEEMASAELRQLRDEYTSQGVSERQLPQGVEGTQTQKIHCKRCGGSDCRVTQVSRGALFLPAWVRRGGPDEDAMTFVTCSRCGQQWYHSSWLCL